MWGDTAGEGAGGACQVLGMHFQPGGGSRGSCICEIHPFHLRSIDLIVLIESSSQRMFKIQIEINKKSDYNAAPTDNCQLGTYAQHCQA